MDNDITPDNGNLDSKNIEQIIFNRIKFLEDNRGIVKLILNENMLNQNNENYIHKMVISLKDQLEKNKIIGDDDFTIRLLMGTFLSFLYQSESNEELGQGLRKTHFRIDYKKSKIKKEESGHD